MTDERNKGATVPAPLPAANTSVQVYIFNQTYTLRSASDEEHVRRVAQLLDERMRHLAALAPNFDTLKIAVLAALHLTEEVELLKEATAELEPLKEETAAAEDAEEPQAVTAQEDQQDEEVEPEQSADERAARSWFEDVFDSEFQGHRGEGERLSARLSERLQTRKPLRRTSLTIEPDSEGH